MGEQNREYSELYRQYEDLLEYRDRLKKEAFEAQREYVRVFGDRICRLFECKISCIRKKKMIAYCQAILNHGGTIIQKELEAYLQKEMAEYQKQLQDMTEDNREAKKSTPISEADALEIRRIYRSLAKRIHPDRNPKFAEDEEILELWNEIVIAYRCNNLKRLQELEILASRALARYGDETDTEIPNLSDRIAETEAEIDHIRSTDPYRYRDLLDDQNAVREKEDSLDREIAEYEKYEEQLENVADELVAQGITITWNTMPDR